MWDSGVLPVLGLKFKIPGCDRVLHALDSSVDVVEFLLDPLDRSAPGCAGKSMTFRVCSVFQGRYRFKLEQQSGSDVKNAHGPEAGEQKSHDHNGSHPEYREVEMVCHSPADPHEDALSGPVYCAGGGQGVDPALKFSVMAFAALKSFVPVLSAGVSHAVTLWSGLPVSIDSNSLSAVP